MSTQSSFISKLWSEGWYVEAGSVCFSFLSCHSRGIQSNSAEEETGNKQIPDFENINIWILLFLLPPTLKFFLVDFNEFRCLVVPLSLQDSIKLKRINTLETHLNEHRWRKGRESSSYFGEVRCSRVLKVIIVKILEGCPLDLCESDIS